jgi:hypothetical protein
VKALTELLVLLFGVLVFGGEAYAQQPPLPPNLGTQPCVGFLLPKIDSAPAVRLRPTRGDVFVSCKGRTIQLTRIGDVSSWAMDLKTNRILLIRAGKGENQDSELVTINLKPWKQERRLAVDPKSFLIPSCGTTLLVNPSAAESNMIDAVSGRAMEQHSGVTQIRCDAHGGTIASLGKATSVNGGPLLLNGTTLRATVVDFSVSRSGRFLAFSDNSELCIYDSETKAQSCFSNFRQVGQLSVWDDGTVVAAAETSQACPLSQQLITQPGGLTWPCPALFELQSGAGQNLIQFLATDPQILPTTTGEFLFSVAH